MKEDLCKTCENHWTDFPLPLEQAESHCTVVDEKVGFGKMNEVVPYPCLECPFNCYKRKIRIQEDKELLLRDLCCRLPYGVKISIPELWISEKKIEILNEIFKGDDGLYRVNDNGMIIEYIKPYLFPLSSMTEEQYESLKELGILSNCSHSYEYVNPHIHGVSFIFRGFKTYSLELIEWLNKNHFDYRGLIPMGLAIDCTNLNIY